MDNNDYNIRAYYHSRDKDTCDYSTTSICLSQKVTEMLWNYVCHLESVKNFISNSIKEITEILSATRQNLVATDISLDVDSENRILLTIWFKTYEKSTKSYEMENRISLYNFNNTREVAGLGARIVERIEKEERRYHDMRVVRFLSLYIVPLLLLWLIKFLVADEYQSFAITSSGVFLIFLWIIVFCPDHIKDKLLSKLNS